MSTHEADKKKFDSDIAKMKANLQEDEMDTILKADKTNATKDNGKDSGSMD